MNESGSVKVHVSSLGVKGVACSKPLSKDPSEGTFSVPGNSGVGSSGSSGSSYNVGSG